MDENLTILIVCSGNSSVISPFIKEQSESLMSHGLQLDYFLIKGKGIRGYVRHYYKLRKKIINNKYHLIHAHYGLSGLVAVSQGKIPVVITFHGSDINQPIINLLSSLASFLAEWNIFVCQQLYEKMFLRPRKKHSVIPCGVDLGIFTEIPKTEARKILGLDGRKKYVLFSSDFNNPVKNYRLARQAVNQLDEVQLLELRNRTRKDVNYLLNASDALLLTSYTEGSPQIIKEALACNCPIVSSNVGDVKELIGETNGCFLAEYDVDDVAEKLKLALDFGRLDDSRKGMRKLDNQQIADQLVHIYNKVLTE